MTTLLRRHAEQNLQKSRSARHLQYFYDVGPCYILTKPTSGPCELDVGLSEGFRRKLEIGLGEAFSGMITPRTISPHPSARHTVHQKQALLRRRLGFRGVGELLARTAGVFVFEVYKTLRFRF